jgi:hypothetical protein
MTREPNPETSNNNTVDFAGMKMPKFVRITLEHGEEKFTLSRADFSYYSGDALIVRLPEELKDGEVKLTIENSDGDRYSTPVTQSFVLQPRQ